MNNFVPKNHLNYDEPVHIKLIGYGQPKEGQYGTYFPDCTVEIQGKIYGWNLQKSMKDRLDEIDVVADSVFCATKKKIDNIKDFIEFSIHGDIKTAPQNVPQTKDVLREQKLIPDNPQGRGASFNLAFHWCTKNSHINDFEAFMEKVKETADRIYIHQNKYVNQ